MSKRSAWVFNPPQSLRLSTLQLLAVWVPELFGRPSAKTDLRVKIFKIGLLAQNSSLALVDSVQSENIGEKWEFMP